MPIKRRAINETSSAWSNRVRGHCKRSVVRHVSRDSFRMRVIHVTGAGFAFAARRALVLRGLFRGSFSWNSDQLANLLRSIPKRICGACRDDRTRFADYRVRNGVLLKQVRYVELDQKVGFTAVLHLHCRTLFLLREGLRHGTCVRVLPRREISAGSLNNGNRGALSQVQGFGTPG